MGKELEELTALDLLDLIEHQARQGVDYMTLHAGILFEHLPLVHGRLAKHRMQRWRLSARGVDDASPSSEPAVRALR